MTTLITIIHILCCVLLIVVVLLQSGKGAEISASFGGSSQTVFGSAGGANFFTRFTSGLAAVFMVTSVLLTIWGADNKKSIFEGAAIPQSKTPVPPPPAAAPAQQAPANK